MYSHQVFGTPVGRVARLANLPHTYAVVGIEANHNTRVGLARTYQRAQMRATEEVLSGVPNVALVHLTADAGGYRVGDLNNPTTIWIKKEM